MTTKEERLFGVVWRVALEAAAPPIKSGTTTIRHETAEEARELLAELGYDWEAAFKEYRKVRYGS